MSKLWNKPGTILHPAIESYTVGDDYLLDMKLIAYDIEGTLAHIHGLAAINILSMEETGKLQDCLLKLKKDVKDGKISITVHDEDCHTVIENYLIKQLGDLGKKVHTGRSRNDQVLTAVRLYLKDHLAGIIKDTKRLAFSFKKQAEKHVSTPMPGYSHTKQAMLSSVGHYLASFVESLLDDAEFMAAIIKHIDKNPLGSAAGFGTSLPIDRMVTTEHMHFAKTQVNSLYCQVSRGKYESIVLEGLVQIMLTLGRFAHDMLTFTSDEFGFFEVDDALTTGSSIMPHKKNLDALEIMRSNVSIVAGNQHIIQSISQKLLSGYNRDLQLIKKSLFESIEIVEKSLVIAYMFAEGLKPNKKNIEKTIFKNIFMADIAIALVKEKNIPFRDAYVQATEDIDSFEINLKQNIKEKVSLGAPGNIGLEYYETD